MRHLSIVCLALTLAAFTVPTSQAATKCIHFSNFCDSIEYQNMGVGGVAGKLFVGSWDWECGGTGFDTSIVGPKGIESDNGTKLAIATRPVDVPTNTPFPYTTLFVFNTSSQLFDLYATTGDSRHGGVTFAFQTNQPYTVTDGGCSFDGAQKGNKPSLLSR